MTPRPAGGRAPSTRGRAWPLDLRACHPLNPRARLAPQPEGLHPPSTRGRAWPLDLRRATPSTRERAWPLDLRRATPSTRERAWPLDLRRATPSTEGAPGPSTCGAPPRQPRARLAPRPEGLHPPSTRGRACHPVNRGRARLPPRPSGARDQTPSAGVSPRRGPVARLSTRGMSKPTRKREWRTKRGRSHHGRRFAWSTVTPAGSRSRPSEPGPAGGRTDPGPGARTVPSAPDAPPVRPATRPSRPPSPPAPAAPRT